MRSTYAAVFAFLLLVAAAPLASASYWNGGYSWGLSSGSEADRAVGFVSLREERCAPDEAKTMALTFKRWLPSGEEALDQYVFETETNKLKSFLHVENRKDPANNQSVPVFITYTLDPPGLVFKPDVKVGDRSWRVQAKVDIHVSSYVGAPQTASNNIHYSFAPIRNETVVIDNRSYQGVLVQAVSLSATDQNSFSYVWLPEARLWASRSGVLFPHETLPGLALKSFVANSAPCIDYDRHPREPWVGERVVFENYGTYDPEGEAVEPLWWDFGDGAAPVQGNRVEHVFHAPGKYYLKVWASDASGNRGELDLSLYPVTVLPQPVVNVTVGGAVKGVYRAEDVLTFGLEGPDAAQFVSAVWDFGDGTTSRDFQPTHEYRIPGLYELSVTLGTPDGRTREISRYLSVGNAGPREAKLAIDSPLEDAAVGPGDPIRVSGYGFSRVHFLLDGKSLMESRYPFRDLQLPWGITPGPHTITIQGLRGEEVVASATRLVTVPGAIPGGSPSPGKGGVDGSTPGPGGAVDPSVPGTQGPGAGGSSPSEAEAQGKGPRTIVPALDILPTLTGALAALAVTRLVLRRRI
ncbi:MAG TPA: PKD domain-containing protein [Candidatus Thermoplasmatota archaeon]|nr:PKD domain-containing protein [Candidatus Thermoplasmatota archaeon]